MKSFCISGRVVSAGWQTGKQSGQGYYKFAVAQESQNGQNVNTEVFEFAAFKESADRISNDIRVEDNVVVEGMITSKTKGGKNGQTFNNYSFVAYRAECVFRPYNNHAPQGGQQRQRQPAPAYNNNGQNRAPHGGNGGRNDGDYDEDTYYDNPPPRNGYNNRPR